MGPRIYSWLTAQESGRYGIVLLDFQDSDKASGPSIVKHLINSNDVFLKSLTNIESVNASRIHAELNGNFLHVNGITNASSLKVYDIHGILLYTQKVDGNCMIELPQRPLYVVCVDDKTFKLASVR